MGEVYKARDERLKRDVAIKVLPVSFSTDPDRLRRFEQEAEAAGALNHPNITAVYDLGSHDGAPYIVTELLEGETLRARLSGGAIAARKAIDYAVQIAQGPCGGAREGNHPPRPETREPVPDERRAGEDPGLRPCQAHADRGTERSANEHADGGGGNGTGRGDGNARLHVARAGQRQARGPALRHFLLWRDPLRNALGRTRVPPGLGGRNHVGDSARGAARSFGDEPEHPAGTRADRSALPREEPRGAFLFGPRPGLRPRGALGCVRRGGGDIRCGPIGTPPPPSGRGRCRARRIARVARGRPLHRQGARRRAASAVPPAHVSARNRLVGPLRLRREDDSLQRFLGRAAGGDLRQLSRESRVSASRDTPGPMSSPSPRPAISR